LKFTVKRTMKSQRKDYDFIAGVPCSRLAEFIEKNKCIIATREDEAMALAVGAYLVGKKPLVFMQNSGLGHIVDITTSLLKPYDIKIDLLISIRDSPEHHAFMGKITKDLLKLMEYENYQQF